MISITIKTDNAAFSDCAGTEVARILRDLADRLQEWPGANPFRLVAVDINGNKVGELKATP